MTVKYEDIANLNIHCETQEQWDAVIKILEDVGQGDTGMLSEWFDSSDGRSIIHSKHSCSNVCDSDLEYCVDRDLEVISYDEFSKLFIGLSTTRGMVEALYPLQKQDDKPIVSDGGSSKYYEITVTNKAGESIKVEMGDIIRACVANDFDLGNIMKACRRISEAKQGRGKAGASVEYDANKIVYFANEVKFWSK